MPALFLNLLKLIFLALLYLFLWQVARAIGSHLGPPQRSRGRRLSAELVVVRSDSLAGKRFSVSGPTVLGRSDDADVLIDDPYASEFHLRVGLQDEDLVVHDLGSTNGTYVNGRRITTPTTLAKGDALQIGKTILEVR
jgi:pSer/pThr/pTyr-binding forkhead associated (FHA) protein